MPDIIPSATPDDTNPTTARDALYRALRGAGYSPDEAKALTLAYAAEVLHAGADWLEGIGQDHAASMLRYSTEIHEGMVEAPGMWPAEPLLNAPVAEAVTEYAVGVRYDSGEAITGVTTSRSEAERRLADVGIFASGTPSTRLLSRTATYTAWTEATS
ncbi:hypothetical protein [Streptomyces sp. NRRL F-5135]|uniref:hypothetical protein n=1 Tax=Streptomyces sp. NRRL F-5135 TaxID=1463858 RepID=UPI0004CC20E6|nr:hypothetical protein [Streptomyces sp. NRRL F-5135]